MSDIRMVTERAKVDELFETAAKIINDCVIEALNYLGLQCVVRIRDREGSESWFDISGNLRSSIGHAIYQRGKKIMESTFKQVLGGQEGAEKGKKLVESLANLYCETYALVVLAAMEYAEFVEAIDSKDVLASTQIWAEEEVNKYIQRAIAKAEKKIQMLEVML